MSFIVKCTNPIEILKRSEETHIISGNFTLKLYNWHKIREFLVQIYSINEEERDKHDCEPHCFIEIITKNNSDVVLEYPYALRDMMMKDYDRLMEVFKKHMQQD